MRKLWAGTLLFLFVLYAPGLAEPFFLIDDHSLIGAPQIQVLDSESIRSIFEFGNHVDYTPIRELSYLLDWQWGVDLENNLTPVRIQNFFWFFGIAFLLAQALQLMGLRTSTSYGLSTIWALHPIHAELFMWGAARKDLLSLFGAMAGLCLFLRLLSLEHPTAGSEASDRKKSLLLFGILLATTFSVFSKATFVFVPFIGAIVLCLRVPLKPLQKLLVLCWLAIDVAAIALHRIVYTQVNPMPLHLSLYYRWQALTAAFGRTLTGLVWPPANILDTYNWGEWAQLNRIYMLVGAPTLVAMIALSIFLFIRTVQTTPSDLIKSIRSFFRRTQNFMLSSNFEPDASIQISSVCIFMGVLLSLLAVTPGFNPTHRAFYSTRYYEPLLLCFLIFFAARFKQWMSSSKAKPWGITLVAALGVSQIFEAPHWHSNLAIVSKSLASTPDNPSLKTLMLQEIFNLNRWGRASKEQLSRARELADSLGSQCLNPNLEMTNGTLCFHFFKDFRSLRVFFDAATISANAQTAQLLLTKSQESTGEVLKSREPLNSSSQYTPTPFSRILFLQKICREQGPEASQRLTREFLSKHLLSRIWLTETQSQLANEQQKREFASCLTAKGFAGSQPER